jgi:hypothetical protein
LFDLSHSFRKIAAPKAAVFFLCVFFFFFLAASAPQAETETSGTNREAMLSWYQDQTGQKVWTGEAKSAFWFWEHWRFGVKALGEWVQPGPGRENDTGSAGGGHVHGARMAAESIPAATTTATGMQANQLDAVSGASSRVTTDPEGHGRIEGALSLQRDIASANPGFVGGAIRYSGETDFHSVMAGANGGVELFQRNTALAGNLGAGFDIADPGESPPGERDRWPTSTSRFSAGVQLGQLLTPRARLGCSYAFTAILGPQENPYRRALVHTTLFPEHLPEARLRHVFGTEIGLYLGRGFAFFHREGLYFDSWGVQSLIPETGLPIEIGSRWMLTPRHRWYSQAPAGFYRNRYHVLDGGWLSGDPRLSRLQGNDFGLDLEYALRPGDRAPAFSVSVSYSDLKDLEAGTRTQSMRLALLFRNPD